MITICATFKSIVDNFIVDDIIVLWHSLYSSHDLYESNTVYIYACIQECIKCTHRFFFTVSWLSLLLFETYANVSSYFRLHTSVCTIGRKSPRALPIIQRSPRKFVYVYILPIRYIWTAHFLHLSFAFTTKNHRKNMKCSA